MKILVTGVAGFIGMHVAQLLLKRGNLVIGIDNLNDYYDPRLKHARLAQLIPYANFNFIESDITDWPTLSNIFEREKPVKVINLAAQAGVRYSLKNPQAYIQTNLVGFGNILEACRQHDVEHLIYASSSSVYGANTKIPFSVKDNVDHPVSLYAASKKANELMAHSYSHLYGLPTTGLRYFTVYGPWGRPDMSPWLFTSAILEERPIDVFNYGKMKRDFTYIKDIAKNTVRLIDRIPAKETKYDSKYSNPATSDAPYRIYNIGSHKPVELMAFIECIEDVLGKEAKKNFLPMQNGDVLETYADCQELWNEIGFEDVTDLRDGIHEWLIWYKSYNRL